MGKSISVDVKKRGRGRPATGTDPEVSARVPKPMVARLDEFAAANGITRSEGIRRLLERGLAAAKVDAVVEANRAAAPKRGRGK